jgi:hypothetical protein
MPHRWILRSITHAETSVPQALKIQIQTKGIKQNAGN